MCPIPFSTSAPPLPIGAKCRIEWVSDGVEEPVYISLTEGILADRDSDEFGVSLDDIFWQVSGEHRLKELMSPGVNDFVVKSYELVFKS